MMFLLLTLLTATPEVRWDRATIPVIFLCMARTQARDVAIPNASPNC